MEKSSITAFIKDAIEGGWAGQVIQTMDNVYPYQVRTTSIFLDPLAWQAVGKTRGWDMNKGHRCRGHMDGSLEMFGTEALLKNLQFICHLSEGKSIEEALASLTPNSEVK